MPLAAAPLSGVAIQVSAITTAGSGGPGVRPIVATYHLDTTDPDPRFSVTGVSGPFIRTSTVRVAAHDSGRYDAVIVTAIPDCSSLGSLDTALAPYELTVVEQDAHGRSAHGALSQTDPPVDWDSAVRRDCWQSAAQQALTVERVRPVPHRESRRLDLEVLLHNGFARGVNVQVLDIADAASVDPADSATIPPGATRSLRVRLQINNCRSPGLLSSTLTPATGAASPTLAWSVGPAEADPLVVLETALSVDQSAVVRRSVQRLCGHSGR